MTDPEPTLLLTRPEPQSREFLERCAAMAKRRLPAIISPILRIVPKAFVPDLDYYSTIIFSSGNGVRSVADQAALKGRRVVTVGSKTAELARSAGADAIALGEDLEAFVEAAVRIDEPALFCRGEHARGDLAARLRAKGIRTDDVVVYDQVEQPLNAAGKVLLSGTNPVLAPVFSPRSAKLLSKYTAIKAPLVVLAMSKNVSDAWEGSGRVLVADQPTAEAMCALTVDQFRNPRLGLASRGH